MLPKNDPRGSRSFTGLSQNHEPIYEENVAQSYGRKFIGYLKYFSIVGLVAVLIMYQLLGAVIFSSMDGAYGQGVYGGDNVTVLRNNFIQNVRRLNIRTTTNRTFYVEVLHKHLLKYERKAYDYHQHQKLANLDRSLVGFWGALFFSATVVTTIGYGHMSPATPAGRVATIIYGTIGIPIFFVVMINFGHLLTRLMKVGWRFSHTLKMKIAQKITNQRNRHKMEWKHTLSAPKIQVDDQFNLPPLLAAIVLFVYISGGMLMYMQWEKWDYIEAFYFLFISVSTIGFGDVLPDHPKRFLATSVYILFGLSLSSMVLHVFMESFQRALERMRTSTAVRVPSDAIVKRIVRSKSSPEKGGSTPSEKTKPAQPHRLSVAI